MLPPADEQAGPPPPAAAAGEPEAAPAGFRSWLNLITLMFLAPVGVMTLALCDPAASKLRRGLLKGEPATVC